MEKPLVPNQGNGRRTQDPSHSARLSAGHCPSIHLRAHPLIRATQTGELVPICAPYLLPLSLPGLQPPALGERGGEEGGGKITLIKCPALPLAALASVLARTCHKVLSDRKQSLQVRSGEPVASVTQTREMASSAEGLALPQPGPVCENTAALLNGDRAGRLAAAGQDGERHWQVAQS